MKTKEHKESNGCEKYYCWRYGLYKINFWTILKKLLQKNDFRRFPLFEIFAQIYDGVCANCARVCRALNEKRGGGGSESWQEVCAILPLSAQIFFLKKEKTFKVDCGNYVHIFDPVQLVASDITIFAQIEKCKYWDYNNFCCNYIKLIIHIH